MPTRRAHYVVSSHWDREWYQSFQDYRYRLVQLLDRVIAGHEDGSLKGPFQTDGQAIVLDDYLEIRPQQTAKVHQLAKDGQLVIGPWYVLPDEFLVSGESIVRNIRLGREIARSFGTEPSAAGWVCDLFGHCGQMPQILAQFDVKFGFIWRGINVLNQRLVRWTGVDGTMLPCFRFGHRGYCSYADKVREAFDPISFPTPEKFAQNLVKYLAEEDSITETGPLLLFDGGDHQEWDQKAYKAVADRLGKSVDGIEVVHSSLDAYIAEMLPHAKKFNVEAAGEMREPALYPMEKDEQWVIPGVLSARIWIKQQNAACETALCSWAEPINALAAASLGTEYPQGYLNVAWKLLLQNHPHDSICGCSVDDTHKDMEHRFRQSRQIADRITFEAARKITANIQGVIPDNELRVTVFNPLPHASTGVQEIKLEIPVEWPGFQEFFGFENKPGFRIYDTAGKEIPYQRVSQLQNRIRPFVTDAKMPAPYKVHEVTVALNLDIPATGYTTLAIRKAAVAEPTRYYAPATKPTLITSERSAENQRFAISIHDNGTLTVYDKETGEEFDDLLTFEDITDIGDGWYHGIAVNDQAFTSIASRSDVAIVQDGPLQATFRIRTTMGVPAEFDFVTMTRSERFVDLIIDSYVTLKAGSDRIEVVTKIKNTAKDHRLRVLFPTYVAADTFLADNVFDVVERPIALRKDNHLYRELEVETKPQQTWTGVFGNDAGLAIVAAGQYEATVRDHEHRPIALTLYRSFRRTVFTDGEPGGQLFNDDLTFRYWIVPTDDKPDLAGLCELGQSIAAGTRTVLLRPIDQKFHAQSPANLPATAGLYELDGSVVVTSARLVGDALEIRLFNPSEKSEKIQLKLTNPAWTGKSTRYDLVNLESTVLTKGEAAKKGKISLKIGGKKIVTIRVTK